MSHLFVSMGERTVDPEIIALAGTAGGAVVTAMVTDGWQQARSGVVDLWRRFRPEAVDLVEQDFDSSRIDITSADDEALDVTQAAMTTLWQGHVLALLQRNPQAVAELRTLLSSLETRAAGSTDGGVHQTAKASGRAQVYQAGRDQTIERGPQ
ncbi:hypothetical protein [Streptomyces sp. NPDC088789]|uniref:hypothetical protein n=1 Tax=Streptomyces sp. NPDC088789 TaxID=3365899 RepID=UPI00380013C9